MRWAVKAVVPTADEERPDVQFRYFTSRQQARQFLDDHRAQLAAAPVGSRIHTHFCSNDERDPTVGCALDRAFVKTAAGWEQVS